MSSLLEVVGLRKFYPHSPKPLLDSLDFCVQEGECAVLLGGSGSGKSTLLRCLARVEDVDEGIIRLEGKDICDPRVNERKVRSQMGLVFQAYNLFPHMTVLNNVTLAPIRVHHQPPARARLRATELLEKIGLADKAHSYPRELSGGEQQRVAIVRALATQPRLLLLDEVTAALDPALTREVLDLLRDLRSSGTTMIISTHELHFAREVSDHVFFLHDGHIAEQGSSVEVFTRPHNAALRSFLSHSEYAQEPPSPLTSSSLQSSQRPR